MVDADTTACPRFIDSYSDTDFNSLQLQVLEADVKICLSMLNIGRLRTEREQWLADAVHFGRQATGIKQLRRGLREATSDA